MAERRMFAKTIIDSDAFLDMPLSTQALYLHLAMRADDDGFVNNPKKIKRMIGASDDDLRVLISKKFIIPFESGIVVIKHWKIHNYIQKDRYKATVYQEEKALLTLKDNGAYSLDTECIQSASSLDTQVRLGKDRLAQDRLGKGSKEAGKARTTRKTKTEQNLTNLQGIKMPDEVHRILVNWLTYKGQSGFSYADSSLKTLVKKVTANVEQYGVAAVESLIDESISNGWKGIIWERLAKPRKQDNTVDLYAMIRREEEKNREQRRSDEGYSNFEGGVPDFLQGVIP